MKLQFKHQKFQADAAKAVVNMFAGQPCLTLSKGSYSLRVSANYRLIISPKAGNLSAESLKVCDTLFIKGVIDYHGKGKKYSWLIP